jgi:hypothetical protein
MAEAKNYPALRHGAAIQETRWNKSTPQAFTSNSYNIFTSSFANDHEFETAFLVDSKINHMDKNFTPINERLCVIRIKGRFLLSYHHYKHQQMTQNRRPKNNFMNTWSEHTQPAQEDVGRERKSWPGNRISANDRQAQPA